MKEVKRMAFLVPNHSVRILPASILKNRIETQSIKAVFKELFKYYYLVVTPAMAPLTEHIQYSDIYTPVIQKLHSSGSNYISESLNDQDSSLNGIHPDALPGVNIIETPMVEKLFDKDMDNSMLSQCLEACQSTSEFNHVINMIDIVETKETNALKLLYGRKRAPLIHALGERRS